MLFAACKKRLCNGGHCTWVITVVVRSLVELTDTSFATTLFTERDSVTNTFNLNTFTM